MKIVRVETSREALDLKRPYVIATRSVGQVELFFVRLVTDRDLVGVGAASPGEHVTGESPDATAAALRPESLDWLVGQDPRQLGGLCGEVRRRLPGTPAARAALDMALHDLLARQLDLPLAEFLGRCHESLVTSITIGIKSTDEALAEAREYLARGFVCIKVKIGLDLDADIERLRKLRETVGAGVAIRVDGNQGYTPSEARKLGEWVDRLDIELVEQPLPAQALDEMRQLPDPLKRVVAADESLIDERDALRLLEPPGACGIFNIKLMKCGGITPALAIARIADAGGRQLMWGCNDESAISICAALHAAYACPATRYLDLDGSFDLARDLAEGGFDVRDGRLWLTGGPGLGLNLVGE